MAQPGRARRQSARRRWQKSPVTGESTKQAVKTIAQGMPDVFRCDRGDYTRVLPTHCTRGCGRFGRPAFPAPSDLQKAERQAKLARQARRDREFVPIGDAAV
jgi:hypothetical protein